MNAFRTLKLAAVGAVPLLLTACQPHASAEDQQAPPPPAVTVAPVQEREIVEHEVFVGRTEAVDHVDIRPRVSGYIDAVRFQAGQLVKKGDVLFLIDPRTRQAALDRAEADLQRAAVQRENAEREADRTKGLLESRSISAEEADTRTWKLADAQAAWSAARAARDAAKLEVEFCEVRSPIDGRASRALVTLGNNVSGVEGATTLLTTVVSVDPMFVSVDLDEANLLRFRKLAREGRAARDSEGRIEAEMGLANEDGFPRKGAVESVDNQMNPDTGSLVVRTVFNNADQQLLPGLFARVRLPVSAREKVFMISDRAVGTDQSRKFVYSLTSSNTVAYCPVVLGPNIDGMRVIREGLKAGEEVVVNGLARIHRPGIPVTPVREPASKLEASAR